MLSLRTQCRLMMLSGWVLPPGYRRETLIQDDGTLSVALEYEGVTRGVNFGRRGWIAWAAYRRLDTIADGMFIEAQANIRRARTLNETMNRNARRAEERAFASELGEGMRRRAERN